MCVGEKKIEKKMWHEKRKMGVLVGGVVSFRKYQINRF